MNASWNPFSPFSSLCFWYWSTLRHFFPRTIFRFVRRPLIFNSHRCTYWQTDTIHIPSHKDIATIVGQGEERGRSPWDRVSRCEPREMSVSYVGPINGGGCVCKLVWALGVSAWPQSNSVRVSILPRARHGKAKGPQRDVAPFLPFPVPAINHCVPERFSCGVKKIFSMRNNLEPPWYVTNVDVEGPRVLWVL